MKKATWQTENCLTTDEEGRVVGRKSSSRLSPSMTSFVTIKTGRRPESCSFIGPLKSGSFLQNSAILHEG